MAKSICSVDDCDSPARALGLCMMHYRRQHKYGSTGTPVDRRRGPREYRARGTSSRVWPSTEEVFRARFVAGEPGDCWPWLGVFIPQGYGVVRYKLAHRLAYEYAVGPIPDGLMIDHICRNKACVNPRHLRLATFSQNAENVDTARSDSRTGVRNVRWQRNRYEVRVSHEGRRFSGGRFTDLAEAEAAAKALRLKLFTYNEADRVSA